jgi:cytochrome P450
MQVKETVLKILTRSFTGTFLGEELASDPKWLQSFEDYSSSASLAAGDLRVWPKPLHSLIHWFLPRFQKLRADLAESCRLIAATLRDNKEALQMGTRADEHSRFPMVEWLRELSGGKTHDPVIIHMSMFVVGLHTTTDMLTQLVYDLSGREELVQQLRQEILSVIAEDGGLQKGSLDKLKLLDSVMKESQRLKPANIGTSDLKLYEKYAILLKISFFSTHGAYGH